MSTYIEQSLGQGETLVAKAHFHWSYTMKAWLALIFLFWCIIGIVIFVQMMVRRASTEIGVTTHRFVEKTGMFSLHTNEVALPNIEGVKVSQGVLGKIFGYGTVRIEGTGVDAVTTPNIADPVGFVRAIQTAKEHQPGKV